MTDNTMGILWALAAAIMAAFTGVLAALGRLRRMGPLKPAPKRSFYL